MLRAGLGTDSARPRCPPGRSAPSPGPGTSRLTHLVLPSASAGVGGYARLAGEISKKREEPSLLPVTPPLQDTLGPTQTSFLSASPTGHWGLLHFSRQYIRAREADRELLSPKRGSGGSGQRGAGRREQRPHPPGYQFQKRLWRPELTPGARISFRGRTSQGVKYGLTPGLNSSASKTTGRGD